MSTIGRTDLCTISKCPVTANAACMFLVGAVLFNDLNERRIMTKNRNETSVSIVVDGTEQVRYTKADAYIGQAEASTLPSSSYCYSEWTDTIDSGVLYTHGQWEDVGPVMEVSECGRNEKSVRTHIRISCERLCQHQGPKGELCSCCAGITLSADEVDFICSRQLWRYRSMSELLPNALGDVSRNGFRKSLAKIYGITCRVGIGVWFLWKLVSPLLE